MSVSVNDGQTRCAWAAPGKPLVIRYHDHEWGVPARDDRKHFMFLVLEGAQTGLNWLVILNKREGEAEAAAALTCASHQVRESIGSAAIKWVTLGTPSS